MTTIEFSTINEQNAIDYLKDKSFSHLTKSQIDFILTNLGKIRVLDPKMHGGGKLSFKNNDIMIDFVKMGTHNPESFMFNHQYISPNLELIKWGLSQGFPSYKFALGKAISIGSFDIVDFYLNEKISTIEDLVLGLETNLHSGSYDFLLKLITKYPKKIKLRSCLIADNFTATELLELINLKVTSHKSLQYSNKKKYNEIVKLKKQSKARL